MSDFLDRQTLFIPLLDGYYEGVEGAQDIVGPYSIPTRLGSLLPPTPFQDDRTACSFAGAESFYRGQPVPYELYAAFNWLDSNTWFCISFWYYLPPGTTQKGAILCHAGPEGGWPFVRGVYFGIGTGNFGVAGNTLLILHDPWAYKPTVTLHDGWNFIICRCCEWAGGGAWLVTVDDDWAGGIGYYHGTYDWPNVTSYHGIGSHWGSPPGYWLTGGAVCLYRMYQGFSDEAETTWLYENPFVGLPIAPEVNIWPDREGAVCFEMDALHYQNEVLDNSLQELEQLKRLDFWKCNHLAIRTDTFGFPLTKYRLSGAFEWDTPIGIWYQDYFDIAGRYFQNTDFRKILSLFDLDQLYSLLYTSRKEVAINYKGEIDANLVFIWASRTGQRRYETRVLTDDFDFENSELEENGIYYFPEKVVLEAHPTTSAFSSDSDLWGEYRNLSTILNERIKNEFSIDNAYHNHEGTIIRFPRFRDFSFNPEDLILYDAWRVGESLSALISSDTISTTKDSYVYALNPNTNYGASTALYTGYGVVRADEYRTLIYFDVSTIPTYHQITKATLRLYCDANSGINQEVQVWTVENAWIENEVTWNNRQAGTPWNTAGGDILKMVGKKYLISTMATSWVEIDVTEAVRDWIFNGITNNGLLLIPFYFTDGLYPANFVFQAEDALGTWEPELVIEHGDFPKIDDAQPVSSSNPYIRDDENLWNWRTSVINEFVENVDDTQPIIPVVNSDFFSEVDTNIPAYGNTDWNGVDMAYTRTNSDDYTRTVGIPDSVEKLSAQWGGKIDAITCDYIATSIDPIKSRFGITRADNLLSSWESIYTGSPKLIFDIGVWANSLLPTESLRPRDLEELVRKVRNSGYRWMVNGWDRITLVEGEMNFWSAISQAINDMGNTWEIEDWVPPEAFNLQMSPETEQSTSVNLQHTLISKTRDGARRFPLGTAHLTWKPLNIRELGLLQRAFQFGRVFQWDLEGKHDIATCNWETTYRFTTSEGNIRYYGSHRSWRAGTIRVKINSTEVFQNDPIYTWTPHYEEGYIYFPNTELLSTDLVEVYYQCRMTIFLQSIVPADTPEFKKVLFLPVEGTFREVR